MSQREKTPYYRGAKVRIHLACPPKPRQQRDRRVQCLVLREETTGPELCVPQEGRRSRDLLGETEVEGTCQ